ncbi:hypothetical protein VTN96DRAFT_1252 [Rasamsonia emersonii]
MASERQLLASILTAALAALLLAVKRLYFHPLSRYNGQLAHKIKHFHEVYGETVRVAPNEVSFINPDSVRDIYNKRPNPHLKGLPKDPIRQPPPKPGQPISILEAGDEDHARIRKAYSYCFSNQALAAQEPLVTSYVDKMVAHLKARAAKRGETVDLQQWISYCTFDIICSLSFGEDFGCLENDRYHEWVGMLVFSLKAKVQLAACRFYPWLFQLLLKTIPKSAQEMLAKHQATTREKVQTRLSVSVERPDFLSHLQKSKKGLTDGEIEINAATLIVAGSHTVQSTIMGIVFHLLQNPAILARVTKEVRSAFPSEEDMDARKLMALPILGAAIKEGMRLTSPLPLGVTRLVPPGGVTICGAFFPEGTIVSYMPWAAHLSPTHFTDPTRFVLERWLDPDNAPEAARFRNDRRDAFRPFLQGPRDCIGKNLAKMEIVLILGRLFYHFDLSFPEGIESIGKWEDKETYVVWAKSPLPVLLTPVQ